MISIARPFRILRKYWKLTFIAVFSLSIAMALGVLALSFSNTFLMLPPAADAPEQLVMIHSRTPDKDIEQFSYPDYKYYRANNHVFTDIAAEPNSIGVSTTWDGSRMVSVVSRPVSDNYFSVMRIRPFLGRLFSAGDDDAKSPVAVMTYTCWVRLGSDRDIVGKTVAGHQIVGVTPKDFTGSFYGLNGDLLDQAREGDSSWYEQRSDRRLFFVARLRPGVTRRQAQAEMSTLAAQLTLAYPKDDKDLTAVITRATLLPPNTITDAELVASVLMALMLLVLLIACANVANLLLAVAVGRRQEAAIKLALGAPRSRLIREFLRESAIICSTGAVLGYGVAAVVLRRYPNVTFDFPMVGIYSIGLNLHLDATVAALTGALTFIAILATGLAPALYASSPNLSNMLGGEIVVGGTRKNVRRQFLVVAQVAVCTLVLVAMGLCQRSLTNLRRTDPGFTARNLVATMAPADSAFPEAQGRQLQDKVRAAIAALPGVESVTLAEGLPLLGSNQIPVRIGEDSKKIQVEQTSVDADYFATFGVRLLEGRIFNSSDRENTPNVVIVNRTMANTFWPGQDAIGKTILGGEPASKALVIGVMADGKYESMDEASTPAMYYAVSQHYRTAVNVVARTKGDPSLWIEPIRMATKAAGVDLPLSPVTFNEWTNFSLLPQRITAGCVVILSALGLLLATVGLLGAISYSVSERKKELGIRAALGAQHRQLLQMILRETMWIAGIGVAIGLLLGIGVTAILRSQLYGIGALEWRVLIPAGAMMMTLSLVIAYVSARPWIAVDPMEAVRHA